MMNTATKILVVFVLCAIATGQEIVLEAHRGVHYDRAPTRRDLSDTPLEFGVRTSFVRHAATLLDTKKDEMPTPVGHRIAVIDMASEFNKYPNYITVSQLLQLSSAGFLFIVPSPTDAKDLSESARLLIFSLEKTIVESTVKVPLYFVAAGQNTTRLIEDLRSVAGSTWHEYVIALQTAAQGTPTKALPTPAEVVVVTMKAKKKKGEITPTLIVAASADTIGAVPTISGGSATGATVWMELLRLFSLSFRRQGVAPTANILFLLDLGGRSSYSGTKQWLKDQETSFLDTIDFALCLEDIIDPRSGPMIDDPLSMYLHVARTPKDEQTTATLKSLSTIGKRIVTRINMSHFEMKWQHEPFAHRKVLAGTVSSVTDPFVQALRSSVIKTSENTTTAPLHAATHTIALWIASRVGLSASDVEFSKISEDHLAAWENLQHRYYRWSAMPHTLPRKTYESAAQQIVRQANSLGGGEKEGTRIAVTLREYTAPQIHTFYLPAEVKLGVYLSHSTSVDIIVTAAIAVYLIVLLCCFQGLVGAKNTITRIVRPKEKV